MKETDYGQAFVNLEKALKEKDNHMAAKYAQVEFYRDAKREYRWRIRAKNGKVLADCGEGYSRKSDCRQAYDRLFKVLNGVVEIQFLDSWTKKTSI